MAETVQAQVGRDRLVFKGQPKSMAAALALLAAGILVFTMGIDRLFFVEAMAWTFLLWGALLMYGHLIDYSTTYAVTDGGLSLYSPLRFWAASRQWDWNHIHRMDLVVERLEAKSEDVEMLVYYTPEGSTVLYREEMPYFPELATEIARRSGLKARRGQAMQRVDEIPQDEKGTYIWQQ